MHNLNGFDGVAFLCIHSFLVITLLAEDSFQKSFKSRYLLEDYVDLHYAGFDVWTIFIRLVDKQFKQPHRYRLFKRYNLLISFGVYT